MYCKHCGKEIDDNSSFCKHCGKTQENKTLSKLPVFTKKDWFAYGMYLLVVVWWAQDVATDIRYIYETDEIDPYVTNIKDSYTVFDTPVFVYCTIIGGVIVPAVVCYIMGKIMKMIKSKK